MNLEHADRRKKCCLTKSDTREGHIHSGEKEDVTKLIDSKHVANREKNFDVTAVELSELGIIPNER